MNAVRLGRARTWNAPRVRLAYTWCAPRLHLQVFDVILKENLRKMQKADLNKLQADYDEGDLMKMRQAEEE